VILGESVFRSRYDGDRKVLGSTIRVNGVETTVVGVMPEGFQFDYFADLWQPLATLPDLTTDKRDDRQLSAFGAEFPKPVEIDGIDARKRRKA
jgi:hypothetical protein